MRSRYPLLAVASLLGGLTAVALAAAPALGDTTGRGPQGQRLTVSKTSGLDPAGETITVSGSGYDTNKGIYVAVCVDTGPGNAPSPCGGGADMSGSSGASHWISSNPPAYGEGLAKPYGPGGSFRVTLRVTPMIGTVDCRTARCAVVSRADHTRTTDRSQDVRLRITFAAKAPAKPAPPTSAPSRNRPPAASGTTATATAAADGPAAAPPPSVSAGPTAFEDVQVTRVSASQSANRWWTGVTVALAAALVTAGVTGVIRRRRRSRAAAR